jgi:uncharacterized OB-fold protein
MSGGLTAWKCADCGAVYFPERYLCAACGGHDIGATTVKEGVVEDMTTVRHVIGQPDWQPRPIATVNIDGGARILAGLLDDTGPNDRVTLFEEDLPKARAVRSAGVAR